MKTGLKISQTSSLEDVNIILPFYTVLSRAVCCTCIANGVETLDLGFSENNLLLPPYFFFPRMITTNERFFLIGSTYKPIAGPVLFLDVFRIAHDAKLAINKHGGFFVPVYEKFLERIFSSRSSGENERE